MDFTKVATITIEFEALQDLLAERTNNPIANAEIPEMLRTAISRAPKYFSLMLLATTHLS